MKQSYSLNQNTRQRIFDRLASELARTPEIVFATCMFGPGLGVGS